LQQLQQTNPNDKQETIESCLMNTEPIAVTGVSVLLPGSTSTARFWRDVLAGKDLIRDVPESHWPIPSYYDPDPAAPDRTCSRRGGFIPAVPFDPLAYGLPPAILSVTDNAQLLALIVAERVLQDAARGDYLHVDRKRISVILGAAGTTELISHMAGRMERPRWEAGLRACGLEEDTVQRLADRIAEQFTPWQENTFPGFLGNVIAGRIANRLDLGGTNCVVDAACASSLAAVSLAVAELNAGGADLVITGGVDALNVPLMYLAFSKTGALSRTGDCRPFSDQADGTILGEGVALFALRRLADAERDDDRIYAVLRGLGTSSDGRSKSIYAPVAEGQARAVGAAYQAAGFSPSTVELIEAHGTGTAAGDRAEFAGLGLVFDAGQGGAGDRRQWCALGSVKSQIGHTKAAAGAAGLFKAVMALHHKVLPPTIKVDRPNPDLRIDESPFYLNTRLRPWVRDGGHPRRAGVSSAGFGGTNFHIALEEYTGPAPRARRVPCSPTELVLASADSPAALAESCDRLLSECEKWPEGPEGLQALARQSQEAHSPLPEARLAVVAADLADLARKLCKARSALLERPGQDLNDPSGIYLAVGKPPGEVAFLFPGQGSQYPGMGQDLAVAFDEARAVWDLAAGLDLDPDLRLHDVVFPRPAFSPEEEADQAARLTRTEWAQPALAACALSYLEVLRLLGLEPDCVAGHSLGELSALGAAGAFGVRELIGLARRRGELMAGAGGSLGVMTAVRASAERVEGLLDGRHPGVVLANRNSPQQVVLSGPADAMAAAEADLATASVLVRRLAVSTAFHSPLVAPAAEAFREVLGRSGMQAPRLPILANSTAEPYPPDAEAAKDLLGRQLAQPVRFREMVEALVGRGVRTFVEVGPGSALTGLVRECLHDREHLAVALDRKGQPGLTSLWHALGQLAVAGVPLRWAGLWEHYPKIQPPPAVPAHAVAVCGSSKGFRKEAVATGGSPVVLSRQDTTGEPPVATKEPPLAAGTGQRAPGWVEAVQNILRDTAKAHETYQTLMAENCHRYFESVDRIVQALAGAGQTPGAVLEPPPGLSPPGACDSRFPAGAVLGPAQGAAGERAVVAPLAALAPAHPNGNGRPGTPPSPSATPAPAPPEGVEDLEGAVLGVVAEKTGYPAELLSMDMDVEKDLGIDSIKRVEILAALEAAVPALAGVDRSRLAGLHTLDDFRVLLRSACCNAAPVADTPAASAAPQAPTRRAVEDLEGAVLGVVAEKTGYPAELLSMDMDVEKDLGIDSIKRVEILAALEAAMPALAGVDRSRLAGLNTLGDFRDLLRSACGNAAPPSLPEKALPEKAIPKGEQADGEPPAQPPAFTRQVVRVRKAPAMGFAISGLCEASPLVILISEERGNEEEAEVALTLAAGLREQGLEVEVSPGVPPNARGVIFLGGLRAVGRVEEAVAVQREAFRAIQRCAAVGEQGGVFVTVQDTGGDFGVSGCGVRAWLGGLPGLVKTAAHECPRMTLKAIDLEAAGRPPEALAAVLLEELLAGGPEVEVGLRADGTRITLRCEGAPGGWRSGELARCPSQPLTHQALDAGREFATGPNQRGELAAPRHSLPSLPTAPMTIPYLEPFVRDGDVVVASGGARGITAAALLGLARCYRLRLVLLGRTRLDEEPPCCEDARTEGDIVAALVHGARDAGGALRLEDARAQARQILQQREIRENLAALRSAGAEVRYLRVDVRDAEALAAGLAEVRRAWGPINGLIHGAGILADRLIKDKTQEQFDEVFSIKVGGLQALLDATRDDPLRLLCLFSSVAARVGNPGQSDYSMANEVLNKVAAAEQTRRGPGCLVKAINWGAWEGGMVTPALRQRFEARGVRLLPLEEGARLLVEECRGGVGEVEVLLGVAGDADPLGVKAEGVAGLDVRVCPRHFGFLRSHCVEGTTPVLPMVLVLEWFVRAARALFPHRQVRCCRDLKVLAGVTLPDFESGVWFRVVCRAAGADTLEFALYRGEKLHYSALVELGSPGRGEAEEPPRPLNGRGKAWPWSVRQAYDTSRLFHGPSFQVLRSLLSFSEHGGCAELTGTAEAGWGPGPWLTNPAALDGGGQLALLWALHHRQAKSLPTRLEAFLYHGEPQTGLLHCDLQVRQAGRHEVLADLVFRDAAGARPVAELRGLTMTLLEPRMAEVCA
jgi:acyl transferase domain-containing protein/acyl carrier protein/NADP-dependent 3-hydroxy acid dehydrogenase YdfG